MDKDTKMARPRGVLSTAFTAILFGPVLVMCWLGRGRLALLYLAATLVVSLLANAAIYAGFASAQNVIPYFTAVDLAQLAGFNLVALVHAMAIRKISMARRWYRWVAIVPAVVTLFLAVLVLPIRTFLYHAYNIPSDSNHPTLPIGDYVFVSKAAYGYSQYSLPLDLVHFRGRIFGAHPARGDIAVFAHPKQPGVVYVKRVIGLPGEHVQIKSGIVYVNGVPLRQEPEQLNPIYYADHEGISFLRETLPNGRSYVVANLSEDAAGDNTAEYVVPDGQYFVMGDNRDNSMDSRFEALGFIPEENFIGPVVWRFWNIKGMPLNDRPAETPATR